MFCTNCGFKLEDGDVFCPNCGQRIEVEESFAESEMFYDDPQPQGMYQSEPPFQKQGGSDAEDTITNYIIAAAGGIGLSWLAVAALRVVNLVLLVLSNIFVSVVPLFSIVRSLDRLVNYLRLGLIWALIIIPIVVIGGLIYLYTNKRFAASKQMIIVGIIDAALVLIAALLYLFNPGYGAYVVIRLLMYLSAIASIVLGVDLFLNVFVEKKSLGGVFNLADDLEIIKSKTSKPSVKVDASHYTDENIPQYELTPQHEAKDSYFDGSGGELFVKWLLLSLLTMVTCGLAFPVMKQKIDKWKIEHTLIEGRRLVFNGTIGQLYLLYIKWFFLSLITCGVYAYLEFPALGYYKWKGVHTAFEDSQNVNQEGEFIDSFFDGNIAETIGYKQLFSIITVFTCFIGYPWGKAMLSRWEKKSS